MNLPKRPVLGRGLGALIPQRQAEPAANPDPGQAGSSSGSQSGSQSGATPNSSLRTLPIESLVPNRDQPRKHFEAALLRELADSIKIHGIVQPIVVTPHDDPPGSFMIVAGERRWRAAQIAGQHDVPVVVRDTPESDRLELAVLENLQRLDLSPIEEAAAYRQLMDVREYTQEQLAERLGKDRSTISNALRLLKLPPKVQGYVQEGRLSMGHARALLALESPADMIELAMEAMQRGYTDYWYNRNVAGKNEQKINNSAVIIIMGDGNDGRDETTARYSLSQLPATWLADKKSPAYRHLDGANYAFADGHVKWLKPEKVSDKKPDGSTPTFAIN